MKYMKYAGILSVLGIFLMAAPAAQAQVAVGIGVGPAVVAGPPYCAYGYYPYAPYACVPYGYYGPQWFVGGVFIGAGPWFHPYHGFYYGRPGYAHIQPYPYRGGAVAGGPVVHSGPVYRGGAVARAPANNFHGGAGFHGGRR
jgi:hypothetical protein